MEPWLLNEHVLHFLHLQFELCHAPTFLRFTDHPKAFHCVDHDKLWKILREMGIPDHLTCLLWNLFAGQEATVRTEHGTTDWFQIEKRSFQVGSCHLSILFLLNIDYSWVQIFCLSFKIVSWVSLGATDGHWNQDTTVIITKDMKISFFSPHSHSPSH